MANVAHEQEAGDALHNATLEVAEELERILKEQSRLQDDLDSSSDVLTAATKEFADCWAAHEATGAKLCHAFREVSNRRAVHDELSVAAKQALQRTLEVKRKATELQKDVAIQKERTRRIMNEHTRTEVHVNDGIGSFPRPYRATELIEEWQFRLQGGQRVSAPADHGQVILFERKQLSRYSSVECEAEQVPCPFDEQSSSKIHQ